MKELRTARKAKLIAAGFLPFEAQELSAVPLNVPYMAKIMAERRKAYNLAARSGKERRDFASGIKEAYTRNRWVRNGNADPWRMLREHEDRFKDTHPAYESPWKKKTKDFAAAEAKLEATYKAKQEEILRKMGI